MNTSPSEKQHIAAMGSFAIMPLFLCTMTLHFDTLCSSTLEAEPGQNVTIWNYLDDSSDNTGHIFWFKHTSDSVPLLLGCKRFEISGKTQTCYFYNENKRIVMSVHGKNTSLTISTVNLSDTGLYYCGFTQLVKTNFYKPVYLHVKGGNETLIKDLDKAKGFLQDCGSSAVCFMLTVVLGAVIVILLSILMITLKHKKTHQGANTEVQIHEDQEFELVNYTALQISKKKTKRTGKRNELAEQHVQYSVSQ